jgi:hypothetical protein
MILSLGIIEMRTLYSLSLIWKTVIEFTNLEDRQGNSQKKLDQAGRFRLNHQNLNMTTIRRRQAKVGYLTPAGSLLD